MSQPRSHPDWEALASPTPASLRAPLTPLHPSCDYAAELNEEQYAAVSTQARHALVIAGAGSGKTRTLTYRVSWLMDAGVRPWRILLLTFTNKAAKEMLTRVSELAGQEARSVWGGTFHSIANRILRRHAARLGYESGFSILDSDDQSALMKSIAKQHAPKGSADTKKKKLFPKAAVLIGLHSLAANTGRSWQDVLYDEYPHLTDYIEELELIYTTYASRKREAQSMDFDDLLLQVVELLEQHSDVREQYQQQFSHILVDEYQDTNLPQSRLIRLLAGGSQSSLMVVGDDAQSIYSWRGADVEHIFRFEEEYPDAELYKIETNYRSSPDILEISNAAIALNTRQYAKELRSHRPSEGFLPAVVPVPDKKMEAAFVARRIDEIIGEGEIKGREIAILYRAHFHSMDLQMELTRQRLPFRITSGLRFFEQAHVKDLVAFMRLLGNPYDELALLRILAMFPRVGALTAQKIQQRWLQQLRDGNIKSLRGAFSTTMGTLAGITAGLRPHWSEFLQMMDRLESPEGSESSESETGEIKSQLDASELIAQLTAYLLPYLRATYENAEDRLDDLGQIAQAAPAADSLDDFLAEITLLSQLDTQAEDGSADDEDCVTLSTIHQAKGLEWKVVFVLSLSDGLFPHRKILERGDQNGLEEETRLFYVAVTRAEDQLYLLYPRYSGGYDAQFCPPSRFLTSLPSEMLEAWDMFD